MPLYMDVHHRVDGLTAEIGKLAHQKDLEVQEKYGVRYLRYWFDEGTGKVFCLVEAPSQGGGRGCPPRGARSDGGRDLRGQRGHLTRGH
jgi:hypothetical protein